jgi:hypothetical protein
MREMKARQGRRSIVLGPRHSIGDGTYCANYGCNRAGRKYQRVNFLYLIRCGMMVSVPVRRILSFS